MATKQSKEVKIQREVEKWLNYYVPEEGATVLQNVISIPSNSDVYRAYFQSQ